jgi:hypothetical protein
MNLPSTDGTNERTWKCKLFGCRDERLPMFYYERGEQHGITSGFGIATVATTTTDIGYRGCHWCGNYKKIVGNTDLCFPAWFCDCDVCTAANKHRPWLYDEV